MDHHDPASLLPEPVPVSDLPETRAQYADHEGLQSHPQEKIWQPNVRAYHGEYYAVDPGQPQNGWQDENAVENKGKRRRCGMTPCVFWSIIAAIVVVVIAGAVGGGVGGSLTSSDNKDSSATTSKPSAEPITSPPTRTSSTASSTVFTTNTIISGPAVLFRDCPSVNETVYSFGASGSELFFRRYCGHSLKNANGFDAIINVKTPSLESCINLCASYDVSNQTQITSGDVRPCNAVCWRNTFDTDWPGQCFGYQSRNVSGQFNLQVETQCDSAGWMNQW